MNRPHKRALQVPVLVALALLSGCRAGEAPNDSAAPEDDGVLINELAEDAFAFGAGDFDLDDPAVGLDDLRSYQAVLTLSFDGTRDGQPEAWTATYRMDVAREAPGFRQVQIETSGTVDGKNVPSHYLAEANGLRFERLGDDACQVGLQADAAPLAEMWEPARMLAPLRGAELVEDVTLGGVPAVRYTFDARARGEDGWVETDGEVSVAAQGGQVMQYRAATRAAEDYFGEGVEGELQWVYSLAEVDQPLSLQIPEGCPAVFASLEPMADTSSFAFSGKMASFSTTAAITEVLAHYQAQLQALGWESMGEPQVGDQAGLASYILEAQQLLVFATAADERTVVWLILEPVQEGIEIE